MGYSQIILLTIAFIFLGSLTVAGFNRLQAEQELEARNHVVANIDNIAMDAQSMLRRDTTGTGFVNVVAKLHLPIATLYGEFTLESVDSSQVIIIARSKLEENFSYRAVIMSNSVFANVVSH